MAAGRLVDGQELEGLFVKDPQWLGIALEEKSVPLLGGPKRGVGDPSLTPLQGLRQRPPRGRDQPGDPLLQDIVGGPGFERFVRQLLPNGSGEEDKGNVWMIVPREPELRDSVEGGES